MADVVWSKQQTYSIIDGEEVINEDFYVVGKLNEVEIGHYSKENGDVFCCVTLSNDEDTYLFLNKKYKSSDDITDDFCREKILLFQNNYINNSAKIFNLILSN